MTVCMFVISELGVVCLCERVHAHAREDADQPN